MNGSEEKIQVKDVVPLVWNILNSRSGNFEYGDVMEQESFSFKKMEEVLQEDVDWHNNGNEVLTYDNDGIDVVISNDRHLRIAFNLAASLGVKRPTWYIKLRDNLI